MPGETRRAATARRTPKPPWLRVRLADPRDFGKVERTLRGRGLNTVCEEARCPNIHECWGERRTATFMVLGQTCTRHCRFCSIETGLPNALPDPDEPARVADAVAAMDLRYAVVTMVARDDLSDGGAGVIAETVRAIRARQPGCLVEVLPSDFMGQREALASLLDAAPDVLCHNVETVRRLTPIVRSRSDYDRSLAFLRDARRLRPGLVTKSSMMLGLGETHDELLGTLDDLRAHDVALLTIGQYLQPTRNHRPVARYVTPDEFEALREEALARGFAWCEAGPLVRSSYHADDQYEAAVAAAARTESQ